MIIGVDGNEANVDKKVGVSVYTFNILQHFQTVASNDYQFVIYLRQPPLAFMPEENENFHYVVINGPFMWSQVFLPLYLFAHKKPDVFWAPAHYIPRYVSLNSVVTIHDLSYFYYPDEFLKKDLYKLKSWTRYALGKAHKIIAVSKTTKKDIVKFYSVDESKIEVIYNGFEKIVTKTVNDNEVLNKWDLQKKRYLLYVGTLQPRKNVSSLIAAYHQLLTKYPDYKLVISGRKGWLYDQIFADVHRLNLTNDVVFTEYISDEEQTALYRNAFCFVLPSLYEGFGIPILEAMSFDCPVLCSVTSSLPEIGGDGCLYFDPKSSQDLEEKIVRLIEDKNLRRELIKKGKERTLQFSWKKCAQETFNLLTSMS